MFVSDRIFAGQFQSKCLENVSKQKVKSSDNISLKCSNICVLKQELKISALTYTFCFSLGAERKLEKPVHSGHIFPVIWLVTGKVRRQNDNQKACPLLCSGC